jgi:CubicO group peptidase (beta-lactamase class C family)
MTRTIAVLIVTSACAVIPAPRASTLPEPRSVILTSAASDNGGSLPNTRGGQQIASWLKVVNTGDRDALLGFFRQHAIVPTEYPRWVEDVANSHTGLYRTDGRFRVGSVTEASDTATTVFLQGDLVGSWVRIRVTVSASPPNKITGFRYAHVEIPAEMLPRTTLGEAALRRQLDEMMDRLAAADAFSGVVLVGRGDAPLYARAIGQASRAWNVPNRVDTKFNLGSVTKTLTAVAVVQLIDQGRLAYDDTLAALVPDYPNREAARRITVRHLLTHTAGLGSASLGQMRRGFRTLNAYMPAIAADSLRFAPGSRFEYSNDGYLLLGIIIERVSGESYYDYVRARIYGPAGMTAADSYELDADPSGLATGYMDAGGGGRRSNIFTLPVKGLPFGLSYATAGDLARFGDALLQHRLITRAGLDASWTGQAVTNSPDGDYGYGFYVRRYAGVRLVGHSGGWTGVTTQLDIYPDLGYTVAILSNRDDSPRVIATKIREWLAQGRASK